MKDVASNALLKTGGTVTGDSNFTGKLQQAGSDVITYSTIVDYLVKKVEIDYLTGKPSNPLKISASQSLIFSDKYPENEVRFEVLITDKNGVSRWLDINLACDDLGNSSNRGIKFNRDYENRQIGIASGSQSVIISKSSNLSPIIESWLPASDLTSVPIRLKYFKLI